MTEGDRRLAEEMTAPMIRLMESGHIPWRMPWHLDGHAPTNLYTGWRYNGINVFLLLMARMDAGYRHPQWLTRRQGCELGWVLKPNAMGYVIVRPVWHETGSPQVNQTGEPVKDRWGNVRKGYPSFYFKWYPVFNVSEFWETSNPVKTKAELLPEKYEVQSITTDELTRLSEARKVLEAWRRRQCRTIFEGDLACYSVKRDLIRMPPFGKFKTHDAFYGVWAHEIIHSTGHEYRLDRFSCEGQDEDSYAYEELVAELGSFLLSQKLKLSTDLRGHAAYLQHWAKILRADPGILLKVFGESSEAVSMVMRNAAKPFPSGGSAPFPDSSSGLKGLSVGSINHRLATL